MTSSWILSARRFLPMPSSRSISSDVFRCSFHIRPEVPPIPRTGLARWAVWLNFFPDFFSPSVCHYLWRGWSHAAYPSYNQTPNYSQGPLCECKAHLCSGYSSPQFIFADRLFITFIFAESVRGKDVWSVREDISELDEGFLDDGKSVEHHHQPPAHVQAEHVTVLLPPCPELGPGVLFQQVEVTQQRQGKAGTRGQSGRSSRGQPPHQGKDQHTAQQQGCRVQHGQHRHGPELES